MLDGHTLLCKGKAKSFSFVAQLYEIIFNAYTCTLYSVYSNNANDCFIFSMILSKLIQGIF